jgi:hypothetical protein
LSALLGSMFLTLLIMKFAFASLLQTVVLSSYKLQVCLTFNVDYKNFEKKICLKIFFCTLFHWLRNAKQLNILNVTKVNGIRERKP